ncbi:glutamate racemase [Alcanivorax hongdengensis A-11-3]|uniref:Glutamate racemase n=1 Tax=Alcanivorax hongdengensis A-11-3 TaxID=1177179 RepID=L0WGC4_9GAMM|nr:glutamate racemase [Alcanivorax hongdengensis]EKF76066.1 glutamate racemase [Alcanivorax hongdengensis A-11-3]
MADTGSIGIFDSGIGGLPIAREIHRLLPGEDIAYVADTHHAPYGEKSDAAILARAFAVTDFLVTRQAKAIVVACNTATTTCIRALRERYALPFIGVEPGIKPAVLNSRSGVVGVLATPKTLVTESFLSLAAKVAGNVKMEVMPCPELVRQVESLQLDCPQARQVVAQYVQPLLDRGADTIVLGCTHYVHLKPLIAEVAGPGVTIISTEEAVARETRRRLSQENRLRPTSADTVGQTAFFSNGDPQRFRDQVQTLWGQCDIIGAFPATV